VIDAVPAHWTCARCGRAIARGEVLNCCGAPAKLSEGAELILQRIEMEAADV